MYELKGRIHGYADEVLSGVRQMQGLADAVQEHAREQGRKSNFAFVEGRQTHLGSRGLFNKRSVIQIEYRFVIDNLDQQQPVVKFVNKIAACMS